MATAKISEIATANTNAPADADLVEQERAADGVSIKQAISNLFKWLLATARTFTAAPVIETGVAGAAPLAIRETGVSGTDDCGQIYYDDPALHIRSRGASGVNAVNIGSVRFGLWDRLFTTHYTRIAAGEITTRGPFRITTGDPSAVAPDVTYGRAAANQARLSATGGADGCWLEFGNVADIGTPSANSAGIGAEGGEVVVVDSAGNETIISPHADDGPAEVYDEPPGAEHVVRTINRVKGEVEYLNMTRAALCAETGERKKCRFVESLDTYNARTGRNKQQITWEQLQQIKQDRYDAERQAEVDAAAKVDADHAKALADHAKLPAAEKAKRAAPEKATVQQPREARDVRKPKPAWIKA